MWVYAYSNELYHYGIKGQKWGVRRYEDESGHLTPAGLKRYSDDATRHASNRMSKQQYQRKMGRRAGAREFRDRQFMAAQGYAAQRANSTLRFRNQYTSQRREKALQKGNIRKADRLERRMDKRNSAIRYNEKVIRKTRNAVTDKEWKNRAEAYKTQYEKSLAAAYTFPISYTIAKNIQANRVRDRLNLEKYKYTPSKKT